jgi:acetoin utilization protein AcuB
MDQMAAKGHQILDALRNYERLARQGGLLVGQVMTGRPSCIAPDTPAVELIRIFHAKQFRHLLVVDEGHALVGVVSDRDVLRCLGPERTPEPSVLDGIAARDVMSTDLITVTPGTSLEQAVGLMIDHGISCLPVQIESTLVGILTNTDLNVVLQAVLQTVRWSSSSEPVETAFANPHD